MVPSVSAVWWRRGVLLKSIGTFSRGLAIADAPVEKARKDATLSVALTEVRRNILKNNEPRSAHSHSHITSFELHRSAMSSRNPVPLWLPIPSSPTVPRHSRSRSALAGICGVTNLRLVPLSLQTSCSRWSTHSYYLAYSGCSSPTARSRLRANGMFCLPPSCAVRHSREYSLERNALVEALVAFIQLKCQKNV